MIYVGISLGRGEPIAYVIAHALKVLGGAAGGRVALQRGAANAVSEARPGVIPGKLPLPRLAHLEDWNWTRAKGYCDTLALARHCWHFGEVAHLAVPSKTAGLSYANMIVMTTRRDALATALALLLEAAASAQNKSGEGSRGPVFVHDLPNLTMDDWQVTVSEVPYPPGRVGQMHHHAGFVLAYVLEGNVVTKVSGQPEKIYKTGEMFYEPPGSTHEVSKNASSTEPAKLLALIFAKKGEALTMPGPGSGPR